MSERAIQNLCSILSLLTMLLSVRDGSIVFNSLSCLYDRKYTTTCHKR